MGIEAKTVVTRMISSELKMYPNKPNNEGIYIYILNEYSDANHTDWMVSKS